MTGAFFIMSWRPEMLSLAAQPRTLGSKPAALRRSGVIPATVYGKEIAALSIELDAEKFHSTYSEAGQTGLVELSIGDQKYAVLIHKFAVHPLSRAFLNVEFYNVLLTEKITTKLPLHLVGDAPASKLGLYLSQELQEVEVEALPQNLIAEIPVDITSLSAVGDTVTVADLKVDKTIEILADGDVTIVKVHPPQVVASDEAEDAAAEAGAVMPEVIGRKPSEEDSPA